MMVKDVCYVQDPICYEMTGLVRWKEYCRLLHPHFPPLSHFLRGLGGNRGIACIPSYLYD